MRLPVKDVAQTYKAMRAFYNLLYQKDRTYTHKLEPGKTNKFEKSLIKILCVGPGSQDWRRWAIRAKYSLQFMPD